MPSHATGDKENLPTNNRRERRVTWAAQVACDVNKSADMSVSSNYKSKWLKGPAAPDSNPRKSILKFAPVMKQRPEANNQSVIIEGADNRKKSFGRLKRFSVVPDMLTKSIRT
jgi:hypothetical protein